MISALSPALSPAVPRRISLSTITNTTPSFSRSATTPKSNVSILKKEAPSAAVFENKEATSAAALKNKEPVSEVITMFGRAGVIQATRGPNPLDAGVFGVTGILETDRGTTPAAHKSEGREATREASKVAEFLSSHDDGLLRGDRVLCTSTGHEMPARVSVLVAHWGGPKRRRRRAKAMAELSSPGAQQSSTGAHATAAASGGKVMKRSKVPVALVVDDAEDLGEPLNACVSDGLLSGGANPGHPAVRIGQRPRHRANKQSSKSSVLRESGVNLDIWAEKWMLADIERAAKEEAKAAEAAKHELSKKGAKRREWQLHVQRMRQDKAAMKRELESAEKVATEAAAKAKAAAMAEGAAVAEAAALVRARAALAAEAVAAAEAKAATEARAAAQAKTVTDAKAARRANAQAAKAEAKAQAEAEATAEAEAEAAEGEAEPKAAAEAAAAKTDAAAATKAEVTLTPSESTPRSSRRPSRRSAADTDRSRADDAMIRSRSVHPTPQSRTALTPQPGTHPTPSSAIMPRSAFSPAANHQPAHAPRGGVAVYDLIAEIEQMQAAEIRSLLTSQGLPAEGLKAAIMSRLIAAVTPARASATPPPSNSTPRRASRSNAANQATPRLTTRDTSSDQGATMDVERPTPAALAVMAHLGGQMATPVPESSQVAPRPKAVVGSAPTPCAPLLPTPPLLVVDVPMETAEPATPGPTPRSTRSRAVRGSTAALQTVTTTTNSTPTAMPPPRSTRATRSRAVPTPSEASA